MSAPSAPDSDDEFRFLNGDAARVGRTDPLPSVSRVSAGTADHRTVSGLSFDGALAPELVTLHGAGLNAHSFDPMLLALGRPALALDLPGHGRSSWRDDADYRPDHLAVDIADAIEQLAPEPVTLLGHSLGGLAAALTAAARPELVRQVILVDMTPGVSPARDAGVVREFIQGQRDFGSIAEIVERAERLGIGRDRSALTRGVTLNTRLRPDGRLEWTHHLAHLDGLPAAGDPEDPQPYAQIWASLESLDIPIALIAASTGMLTTDHVDQWRQVLPHSAVITLSGPHNLHEAAPRELADAVRSLTQG